MVWPGITGNSFCSDKHFYVMYLLTRIPVGNPIEMGIFMKIM